MKLNAAPANQSEGGQWSPGLMLQRKCDCGTHTMGGSCDECAKKKGSLQRKASKHAQFSVVPSIVHEVLASPGHPLDAPTRAFMEPRFGHDFSRVRVHSDGRAADSARAVNALAYTVGRDVVLGEGLYRPETTAGRSTLAHELTHVVQQSGETQTGSAPLEIGPAGDIYEQEADAAAHQVARGAAVSVQRRMTPSSIRRLQRQTQQDTHAGLFELTRHGKLGAPTFRPVARYDVRIEFLPYDIVNCSQVALTQISIARLNGKPAFASEADKARALTAAEGTKGIGIDRLSGSTSPFYGTENTGVTGGNAHFGSHTPGKTADRAWLEDKPGLRGTTPDTSRRAGLAMGFHFETCAICAQGTDKDSYYGCVSWGYDISGTDVFTEEPFAKVSRGTPSSDFLAAAKKWNVQTVPVATTDLPLPTHVSRNSDMTLSELDGEITSLETKLKGLAAGDANVPQVTFELRVLRDIRDSIAFNEKVILPFTLTVRQIQVTVGAKPNGKWNYETITKLKIYQGENRVPTTGRVDAATLRRLEISQLGDFPTPSEKIRSTA
ncbi:MAG TPA: DUF4157 domain-containing protein [Pyrinomonadaceae bacterium]|nr:DUF4157 domain-containing protein [Pyrinomonadaceae bacterium]